MPTALQRERARQNLSRRKPEPFRKHTVKKRSCLCCGEEFRSEGPHNRMCVRCRLLPSATGFAE